MTHSNPRKCTQVFNLFFILLGPILISSCSEKIVSDGLSIKQVTPYQYYKNHYLKKETKTYREKLLFSNEERDQFQSFNGKPTEALFNLLEKREKYLGNQKKYLKESCSKNNEKSCFQMEAINLEEKRITKQNESKRPFYQQYCLDGFGQGCSLLGLLTHKNINLSKKHYKKACDLHHEAGCDLLKIAGQIKPDRIQNVGALNLQFLFNYFEFNIATLKEARKLYKKDCGSKNLSSCMKLGLIEDEVGNLKTAKTILNNSCNQKHSPSCHFLGLLNQRDGQNETSRKYYEKSCELNNKVGCDLLAKFEEKVLNFKMAQKHYKKACELGLDYSCAKVQ